MEEKKQIKKIFIECTQAQYDSLKNENREKDAVYLIPTNYNYYATRTEEKFGHFKEQTEYVVARKEDTVTETFNGLEMLGADADVDTKEKFVVLIKNGLCVRGVFPPVYNPNPIYCRISLENPRYLLSDEYLTQEEKEWFIQQVNENWNTLTWQLNRDIEWFQGAEDYSGIITYEGVTPFKESDTPPDYTSLPVKGE